MGSAYTPGLTVSGDIIVRRTRRLPIKGDVLVKLGDKVSPFDAVARALLPGALQTIRLSEKLGVEPKDAVGMILAKIGDDITKGQLIAESKGLFGFFKSSVVSDVAGTLETVSEVTGNALVREPSLPVDISAYIEGVIAEILPGEGAIVETRCAMVQGIFGIGGERTGTIRVAVANSDEILDGEHILESDRGKILVGGSCVTLAAIQAASKFGVTGLVAGGIKDSDLIEFLGYDIGVAITGQEPITLSIVVTEGFGYLSMAKRTFELLQSLEGQSGSINGSTQIRAGVIRPEVIIPIQATTSSAPIAAMAFELKEGSSIRIIREPYFGELGIVTALPSQIVRLESGTEVRVLKARLKNGDEVIVPRANVEIVAS